MESLLLTIPIQDRNARNALPDKHMDDIHDRGIHGSRRQIFVRSHIDVFQGFLQILRLLDVDGDELQDAVLRDNAHDHVPLCLVIDVDERYPPCPGFQHPTACLVQWFLRVNGNGLDRRDAKGFLDIYRRVRAV